MKYNQGNNFSQTSNEKADDAEHHDTSDDRVRPWETQQRDKVNSQRTRQKMHRKHTAQYTKQLKLPVVYYDNRPGNEDGLFCSYQAHT